MTPTEKEKLEALFDGPARWCKASEAADAQGDPVDYNAPDAAAWDIVGGLCVAFGWNRARELFPEVNAHFVGDSQDAPTPSWEDAMRSLSDFNDDEATSFQTVSNLIRSLPTARTQ